MGYDETGFCLYAGDTAWSDPGKYHACGKGQHDGIGNGAFRYARDVHGDKHDQDRGLFKRTQTDAVYST